MVQLTIDEGHLYMLLHALLLRVSFEGLPIVVNVGGAHDGQTKALLSVPSDDIQLRPR